MIIARFKKWLGIASERDIFLLDHSAYLDSRMHKGYAKEFWEKVAILKK